MDGNDVEDDGVDRHHGTDSRAVFMEREQIGSTYDARDPNICIKGGGDSRNAAKRVGESHNIDKTNSWTRVVTTMAVLENNNYYSFVE